jgi:hypothetical protein
MIIIMQLRNLPVIIVHCPQKVGSTGLVSSLRLFAIDHYDILHIHDERVFAFMGLPPEIKTVNDLTQMLINQSKYVIVIQIYKPLIERNISCFFEHCASFHFNTDVEHLEGYKMDRLIKRFNQTFLHLDDWTKNNSYTNDYNGAKVIKLVVKSNSTNEWSHKLSYELGIPIYIIVDRPTKSLKYKIFKEEYKIPIELLNIIFHSDELNELNNMKLFFNDNEINDYYNYWLNRSTTISYILWSEQEYALYYEISSENQINNVVNYNHYTDCGCVCRKCLYKRMLIRNNFSSMKTIPKIEH